MREWEFYYLEQDEDNTIAEDKIKARLTLATNGIATLTSRALAGWGFQSTSVRTTRFKITTAGQEEDFNWDATNQIACPCHKFYHYQVMIYSRPNFISTDFLFTDQASNLDWLRLTTMKERPSGILILSLIHISEPTRPY